MKNWIYHHRIFLILLTTAIILTYANSFGNAFVSDDLQAILENKNLGHFQTLNFNSPTVIRDIFYYSIFLLFGRQPFFYHLFNLVFHVGNVLLLYALLTIIASPTIGILASALLAVHPLQSEAVTWVSGGTYSQYSFFLLLSLVFFALSWSKAPKIYWLSVGAFLLGLLSSDKAIVFLPILMAFCFTFSPNWKKDWRKLIPFVALTLFGGLRLLTQVNERVATLRNIHYEEPVTYNPFLQIPIAISSYLQLIFWPKDLTIYHTEMSFSQTQYLLRLIAFLFVVGLFFWGLVKNRPVFFWLALFFIALAPTLTPWGLSWIVAERYAYLAAMGIYVLIASLIAKVGESAKFKSLVLAAATAVILALSARTILRNRDWRTADDLWLAAAKTSPSSHVNHNNLGDLYARRGDFERAIQEFQTAIKLKPNYADAYHNLANTYKDLGLDQKAISNYQKALQFNPNLWQSHQNLASIYFQQAKYEEAKTELEKALEINPNNTFLHSNLGAIYLTLGDKEKAYEEFQKALQLDQTNEFARRGLSSLP